MARHNVEKADQHENIGGVKFVQDNHAYGNGEEGAQVTKGTCKLHAVKSIFGLVSTHYSPSYIF
jgi:hypothetical protein